MISINFKFFPPAPPPTFNSIQLNFFKLCSKVEKLFSQSSFPSNGKTFLLKSQLQKRLISLLKFSFQKKQFFQISSLSFSLSLFQLSLSLSLSLSNISLPLFFPLSLSPFFIFPPLRMDRFERNRFCSPPPPLTA